MMLTRVLLAWFGAGLLLLLLGPATVRTPLLGWAPLLWLVIAPLLMLFWRHPQWPLQLLARWLRHDPG